MTVKCLSDYSKTRLRHQFVHENASLDQLATEYNRSRRTVIRTLEEAAIDPGVKKRQPKVKKIDFFGTDTGRVSPTFIDEPVPWYTRIARKFGDWFINQRC